MVRCWSPLTLRSPTYGPKTGKVGQTNDGDGGGVDDDGDGERMPCYVGLPSHQRAITPSRTAASCEVNDLQITMHLLSTTY